MHSSKEEIKGLKRAMKLDLNSTSKTSKKQRFSNCLSNVILSSPDLNMLNLASPELEKLIIQQNGFVTTTPTPTQILFPKEVTVEQETYAKGFVDALAQLHDVTKSSNHQTSAAGVQDNSKTSSISNSININSVTNQSNDSRHLLPIAINMKNIIPVVANHNSILANRNIKLSSVVSNTSVNSVSKGKVVPQMVSVIKEEPQTVPSVVRTPPLSPIDMVSQERIKLNRKRERNRVAAMKCRQRKLERISRLQGRVDVLKSEIGELENVVTQLHEQISQLKQEVMDHAKNGCQIMVSQL